MDNLADDAGRKVKKTEVKDGHIKARTDEAEIIDNKIEEIPKRRTERIIDAENNSKLYNRIIELRQKLQSDLKRSGNFGYAEVNIKGVKDEFYAHSSIDSTLDRGVDRLPDITLKPDNPVFKAKQVPGMNGIPYLRDMDTEYKILNQIAKELGDETKVKGTIRLFTDRTPCESCSDVIDQFLNKYKNIYTEILNNDGNVLFRHK